MPLTLSLRSTALRPLLEAFSTGAGTRFGLNVDCLEGEKRQLLYFMFMFSSWADDQSPPGVLSPSPKAAPPWQSCSSRQVRRCCRGDLEDRLVQPIMIKSKQFWTRKSESLGVHVRVCDAWADVSTWWHVSVWVRARGAKHLRGGGGYVWVIFTEY